MISNHRLILGGHSFIAPLGSDPPASVEEQRAIVGACVQHGIRTFDTTYAPERTAWARAIDLSTADMNALLTPIVWNFFGPLTDPLPGPLPWTDERLESTLTDLLPWTGAPAVVIHTFNDADANRAQAACVRRWKTLGRIGAVGVWPGSAWAWVKAQQGLWDFVVTPLNIKNYAPARSIFREAKQLGWTTVATSPFVRGWELDVVTRRFVEEQNLPEPHARARAAGAMLRFSAFDADVDHVVVAMRSPRYVAENVASLAKGRLIDAERKAVVGA